MDDIQLQNSLIKAINEASPEGILVVDDKGVIVSHNRRFIEIWKIPTSQRPGSEAGTIVGKKDNQILSVVIEGVQHPEAFLAKINELYANPELDDHSEIELCDGRTLERRFAALRNEFGSYLGRVWFFLDITERKQAEERLRFNQFVSDHAPDNIMWIDEQARIVYVNEATCHNYGYTRDELLAKTIFDIDPGSNPEGWPEHWKMLLQKGSSTFETTHRRKDGSVFPIEVSANSIEFSGRELNIAFIRDITERKQQQTLHDANQERFEKLFEYSSDGMFILDMQGNFIDINRTAYESLGYAKEEMMAMKLTDLDPPEFAALVPERMKQIKTHGMAVFETAHYRKDRSVMPVEVKARVMELGGEKVVFSVIRDITERKKNQAALHYSEERFRDVSEAAGEYLWEIDANMVYTYVSHRSTEVKGYTPEELLGHTPMEFMPEDDIQPVGKIVNTAIANKTPFKLRHRDITKTGAVLWEEVNGVPFYDRNGKVIGLRGTGLNITERIKAEAELRIASVAFESQEILIITDADGVILRVNQAFTENTGYTSEEAVGQTPRILKSGRHDAEFYREMWDTLKRTGTWQGEVWDRRKNGEIYPKWLTISAVTNPEGMVTHYVGSHIDITERKAAEDKIKHLAFYDPLTQLPNRRLLMDRLQHAMASCGRSGRKGALLFIDLDHFKTLNDTLGHDIGDLLLIQVAHRLESCVREGDTVARLGGDEFVLILEDLSVHAVEAAAQTETIGAKILAVLSQPYQLGSHECRSTPSIGITFFCNTQSTLEELMKQADIAMYQAKKAGRNTLCFFDPAMQASIHAHATLENELRQAIEKQQFQLHFQIQVDVANRPLGAEALIRWIHPDRGLISPAQFIPLAEETGLMQPIGQWVLNTACAQLKAWQQKPLTRNLVLAVNISAKRFRLADFAAEVKSSVHRHGIDPRLLKLELTEGLLLESIEEAIATMNALNEIGVELSLDDFGTGYSSLQYLKRLPLDQLKIDQSFIRDLVTDSSDRAIVRTIIAMAESLDLDVIAEGVETAEQRQQLLVMGCRNFQGYLFGKPVPIKQFEWLLEPR